MRLASHWSLSIPYGICSLINLLLPLVLVRILSVEQVGQYKLFFLYFTLGQWIFLGPSIRNGVSYWSRNKNLGTPAIRAGWSILLASTIFLGVVGLFVIPGFTLLPKFTPIESALLVGSLVLSSLSSFYEETLIARGKIWEAGLFYLVSDSLKTACIVTGALIFQSLSATYWLFLFAQGIKLIAGLVRDGPTQCMGLTWDTQLMKSVGAYTLPIYFTGMMGVLLSSGDQLIVSQILSPSDFAYYSLGCLALPPLLLFEQSVNRLLIPQLAGEFSRNFSPDSAKQLYTDAIEELGFLLIPAVTLLIIFAKPIIQLLFTERYLPAAAYLQLYSLDYLFFMIPFDAVQRARGDSRWGFKNSLILLPVSLLIGVISAHLLGAWGPLLTLLLTHLTIRVLSLRYLRQQLGWTWTHVLPLKALSTFTGLSLILGFVCRIAQILLSKSHVGLLVLGPSFLLIYWVFGLRWRRRWRARRNRSIKVLMLTQFLRIGGLEKMIFNLSQGLQSQRHTHVSVYAFDETPLTATLLPLFKKANLPVTLTQKGPRFSLRTVVQIAIHLFRADIQILHTHDLNALIYGVLAKLLTFGKVRIVHTQHTLVHLEKFGRKVGFKYVLYEKFFSFFADFLCPVSDSLQEQYQKLGIGSRKSQVVLNGVSFPQELVVPDEDLPSHRSLRNALIASLNDSELRARLLQQVESIWILCLARVSPEKGQAHVLKIWNSLSEQEKAHSSLLFVGPLSQNPTELLTGQSFNGPALERIFFLGPSNSPEQWIAASHLLISGSEFEGLPLGPLEALGAGRPAILSDIAGHQKLAQWSQLFPLHSREIACQKLADVLHQIQSARVKDHGSDYYRETWKKSADLRQKFSLETMVKSYGEIYDRAYF